MKLDKVLKNYDLKVSNECVDVPLRIKKINIEKKLATGQVYAPGALDSHGHFMEADELEKVAHEFLANGMQGQVDMMHDHDLVNAVIVESFIARGHPDYEEGSWVATVKINDNRVWKAVKAGRINGFSFEILTYRDELDVEIQFSSWYYGWTDPDPNDGHVHAYMVKLNDSGDVFWGNTSEENDHIHNILMSNITDKADDGHSHRIHLEEDNARKN